MRQFISFHRWKAVVRLNGDSAYLNTVLKAIELKLRLASSSTQSIYFPRYLWVASKVANRLTSQHEFAIWQPAWPTIHMDESVYHRVLRLRAMQDRVFVGTYRLS